MAAQLHHVAPLLLCQKYPPHPQAVPHTHPHPHQPPYPPKASGGGARFPQAARSILILSSTLGGTSAFCLTSHTPLSPRTDSPSVTAGLKYPGCLCFP